MNNHMKTSFTTRIIHTMFNTVTKKKIAILGFAFKKDTGDVRETPAITICDMLMQDGAIVNVFDPKVERAHAMEEMKGHNMEVPEDQFVFTDTVEEAVKDAHAIVVLTEWEVFKTYDYKAFYEIMEKPAFLFDGRNLLDPFQLDEIGYEVHSLGKSRIVDRSPGNKGNPDAQTQWDAFFKIQCRANEAIVGLESHHSNNKEDRVFKIRCARVLHDGKEVNTWVSVWTHWQNKWDEPLNFECPPGMLLVGIGSQHHNSYEDRRFMFRCAEPATCA